MLNCSLSFGHKILQSSAGHCGQIKLSIEKNLSIFQIFPNQTAKKSSFGQGYKIQNNGVFFKILVTVLNLRESDYHHPKVVK